MTRPARRPKSLMVPAADGSLKRRALVVRLDDAGDMLLAGPAIRAVAAHCGDVVVLAGPHGQEAARLLPGVARVLCWTAPWIARNPPPVRRADILAMTELLAAEAVTEALILGSFHQSPLPTALMLRMAGIPRIAAISTDYPGALLDVRLRVDADLPESERNMALARAVGYDSPPGDDGRLAVRQPLPDVGSLVGGGRYVVLHPGASAPARRWPAERWAAAVTELAGRGRRVVVTGGPRELRLTAAVCGATGAPDGMVTDLAGRTGLAQLAAVLAGADTVVVANTGVAHLAAAVGTNVVSLFAPVVPAARWAPYGVPHVLLGDQSARCRGSRAVTCPEPGHPCLTGVTAAQACDAVDRLAPLERPCGS